MGALIDAIARAGKLLTYARSESGDEAYESREAAHSLAWDLAEDLRDMGLQMSVAWEADWVRISWPGGSDFCFRAQGSDAFALSGATHRRERIVSRDELMLEIGKWIETIQRELT